MGRFTLLYRLMLRPLLQRPGRALLILFAIALGDAAVVAIDMAGDAAAGSFRSSMESFTGNNDLEITAAGGVPETIAAQLARLPLDLRLSPRIEDHATIVATGETVPLIGIDLVGEANGEAAQRLDQAGLRDPIQHINDPDAVWVAGALGKAVGEKIDLLINDQTRDYTVRGLVPDTAKLGGDAILMDIRAAQQATGKSGRVDRILIKTPRSGSFDDWQRQIRRALPAGIMLSPQGSATAANRRMLAAFRWNLRVLSYIALLVGAFLIYNAISVSVVRRRADIGAVRALGASRNMVLSAFLLESSLFGLIGSLAALPLGRLLASGAVGMLSTTVNALYVSSTAGALRITTGSVLLALIAGMGVTLASALAPAREASQVPPTEAMARGRREYEVRIERHRDALIALILAVLGAVAAQAPEIAGKPLMGYLAAMLFVGASALLTPLVVHAVTFAGAGLMRRLMGVEALLACRSLGGSLRRTSVLVGALATAIAMMTSVGIMVGSFRQTVLTWMDAQLSGDLYLRPAGALNADQHPTIAPRVAERIASVPGVESVARFRAYEIEYQGLPATLAGVDIDLHRREQSLSFLSGRPPVDVLRELAAGDNALVSEPFANKHHVKAGDTITLPLGETRPTFRILDIFYDYGHEAGYILLARQTMLKYLPNPAPTNLAVFLKPGADLESTRAAVQKAVAGSDLLILSNAVLRREGIRVFDQTFAITYALEAISILVAIGGIAGALLSIVMDRRREFGILRFLGGTGSQIRKLTLVEAGLIGLLANATGLALGFVLSLVLIYVINKQSFGWTIQFHWPVTVLLSSLSLVYVATVLAGIAPARIAVRLNPIEVVHEE
ncbi:FtsX-like permease family protein [Acidobacteria bacterium AB60]|nr:FtsX-like permease family protein [Acidobacteria bacterium AB60]